MRTTLNISDSLLQDAKLEAARQGCTLSELVETALRLYLPRESSNRELPPLPALDGGEAKVDIADRDALYDAMEE